MEKLLLLGDEAIAQGAIDGGMSGIYAYPGTPSTEIMEFVHGSKIAEELNQCKTNNNVLVKKSWWYVIKKYISWLFIKKCLQKKTVKKNCIHCKRCVKLCPTNNIIEEAGKIKFKSNNNCIYCLACIQWCPMQAINFGNYNLKDKQYHHPEVVENELFKRW